jgi:hypothetical protein
LYALAASHESGVEVLIANPTPEPVRCNITGIDPAQNHSADTAWGAAEDQALDGAGGIVVAPHSVRVLRPHAPTSPASRTKE